MADALWPAKRRWPRLVPLLLTLLLAACANLPDERPLMPRSVEPVPAPPQLERVANGAIFRPDVPSAVFGSERRPRALGDMLKVDIAESLQVSSKQSSHSTRDNQVSSKGPGSTGTGLLSRLMNINASASGSDAFKGSGEAENESKFNGRVVVSVIRVLGNGHLLVAGQRSIALTSGTTVLRFSGVVNPQDIQPGDVVASANVADAQLESLGRGELGEATRRSWLQRLLTRSLQVW